MTVARCNGNELSVDLENPSVPVDVAGERSRAALKRSEAFLLEAQRLSCTGSFSWRVASDEIAWSEQLYRIFEFEQGAPVSFALIDTRVHPEDLPSFQETI